MYVACVCMYMSVYGCSMCMYVCPFVCMDVACVNTSVRVCVCGMC